MPNSDSQVDVVIVGAGMVGLCVANLLAMQGKSITIVDKAEPPVFNNRQAYEARVTAVSPGSKAIFEYVNAWQNMQKKRIAAFDEMLVWDEAGKASINFKAQDLGQANLGYIIENSVIQSGLFEALQKQTNVNWFIPAVIKHVIRHEECIEVTLDNGKSLFAKLLIGADGHRSSVRQFAEIGFTQKSYQQQGIVACVQTELVHDNIAWQRFLKTGPLAFLPLKTGEYSIVWSVSDDYASELMEMSEQEFAHVLTQASEMRLGNIELSSKRAIFPLLSGQAETMIRPRIVLVGDAVHALHPLAGQGANLGFTDAAVLADMLTNTERDIGSYKVLRKYERARVGETQIMQRAMDAFITVFGSTATPIVIARDYALNAADQIQPLKKFFMRHAMGLNKDRPEFAR